MGGCDGKRVMLVPKKAINPPKVWRINPGALEAEPQQKDPFGPVKQRSENRVRGFSVMMPQFLLNFDFLQRAARLLLAIEFILADKFGDGRMEHVGHILPGS